MRKLARAHGVSTKSIIHSMFHKNLNLSKKSAILVPNLLNDDTKKGQVRTSKECLVMVQHNLSMDNIITMYELTVSFHTPKTKQQTKQQLEKTSLGLSRPKSTPR